MFSNLRLERSMSMKDRELASQPYYFGDISCEKAADILQQVKKVQIDWWADLKYLTIRVL